MHPSVVVDASLLTSWFLMQDVNYTKSDVWFSHYLAADGIVSIPEFALVELSASIVRQTQQPSLAKSIAVSLYRRPFQVRSLDRGLVATSIDIAADLRLKAGDAIYVALAHQLGIPLVSWDKEQLQRASTLIETYTPDNYPF